MQISTRSQSRRARRSWSSRGVTARYLGGRRRQQSRIGVRKWTCPTAAATSEERQTRVPAFRRWSGRLAQCPSSVAACGRGYGRLHPSLRRLWPVRASPAGLDAFRQDTQQLEHQVAAGKRRAAGRIERGRDLDKVCPGIQPGKERIRSGPRAPSRRRSPACRCRERSRDRSVDVERHVVGSSPMIARASSITAARRAPQLLDEDQANAGRAGKVVVLASEIAPRTRSAPSVSDRGGPPRWRAGKAFHDCSGCQKSCRRCPSARRSGSSRAVLRRQAAQDRKRDQMIAADGERHGVCRGARLGHEVARCSSSVSSRSSGLTGTSPQSATRSEIEGRYAGDMVDATHETRLVANFARAVAGAGTVGGAAVERDPDQCHVDFGGCGRGQAHEGGGARKARYLAGIERLKVADVMVGLIKPNSIWTALVIRST